MRRDFETVIRQRGDDYDSNAVAWLAGGVRVGSGYQGKKDGRLHVVCCPSCRRENYAMAVASGRCFWCGFEPGAGADTSV